MESSESEGSSNESQKTNIESMGSTSSIPGLVTGAEKKKKHSLAISTENMVAHVQTPDQKPIPPVSAPYKSSAYQYLLDAGACSQRKHGHLRRQLQSNTTDSPILERTYQSTSKSKTGFSKSIEKKGRRE